MQKISHDCRHTFKTSICFPGCRRKLDTEEIIWIWCIRFPLDGKLTFLGVFLDQYFVLRQWNSHRWISQQFRMIGDHDHVYNPFPNSYYECIIVQNEVTDRGGGLESGVCRGQGESSDPLWQECRHLSWSGPSWTKTNVSQGLAYCVSHPVKCKP